MLKRLAFAAAAAVATHAQSSQTQIDAWGANSIRVRIAAPGQEISDPPINGLLDAPPVIAGVPRHAFVAGQTTSVVPLTNGNLQVWFDGNGYLQAKRVDDGVLLFSQTQAINWGAAPAGTKQGAASARLTFAGVNATEQIVGFGEQQDGQVVKTLPFTRSVQDTEYYPLNHGSQAFIPLWHSSAGYSVLVNSPGYGVLHVDSAANGASYYYWNATQGIDLWISTVPTGAARGSGAAFPPLLSQYADAAGHAPTMPQFATGFLASKDRYRNQSQLLDVARGYVTRGLPISLITIDWLHWVSLGDWALRPECWPDVPGMVAELASMGIELMVTFWPFMNSTSVNWGQFSSEGYLATNRTTNSANVFWYCQPCNDAGGALVDSTSPYTRQAVFDRFWANIGQYGVKAVWLDETEPDRFGYTYGSWQLAAGSDYEVGGGWKKTWIRTLADGFASKGVAPGQFFLLSRSFWLGTQQYGNTVWSGDLSSTWAELTLQVQAGQGAGLTGQGMWTTDIGGYTNGDPSSPDFQELVTRWFQFGLMSPVMRLHGHRDPPGGVEPPGEEAACWQTHGDNEPWNLVPEGSDHYHAIVAAMRLRENLRDYVTAINGQYATTGLPLIRPMMMVCPQEAGCTGQASETQYMFGPDWLVAPITAPLTSGGGSKTLYLPSLAGTNTTWVHWWSQTDVGQGGQSITWTYNGTYVDFPLYKRTLVQEL